MFEKTENSKIYPEKATITFDEEITEHSILTVPEVSKNDRNKPKFPDGGWGWMIVLSSLFISLIQDGISFSLGLLQPRFVEQFQTSQSACAWIGSLLLSVPLMGGPFMSALVDKYGCRKMTIVGGFVSASGFLLSFFANSIEVMYLTFGIITGLGLGLTYITAVVSIAFWFDKKRNLAVGLGACGTGIGTILYAPFTNILLEHYGWRGTAVILAGTLLNMCACGALMRDPDWLAEQNKLNESSKSSSVSNVSVHSQKINLEDIRGLLKSGKDGEYVLQTLATSIDREDEGQKAEHHQSVLNLPTFIKQNERVPVEVLEHLSENKKLYKVIVQNYPSLLHCRSTSEKGLNTLVEDPSMINRIPVTFSFKLKKTDKPKTLTHQYSLQENAPAVTEPLMAKERKPKILKSPHVDKSDTTPWLVKQFSPTTTHQNYFKNMRFPRHSLTHRSVILNKNKYKIKSSSCPNIYRVSMTTLFEEEDEKWYSGFVKMLYLFDELHFLFMAISTIILFAWFMTPYMFIPDHLEQSGYSSDEASIVLSVIGAANTIGMVVLGWAGDQSWCNVQKTYGSCLMVCGACCSAIYLATSNYIVVNIFGALFGVSLASCFSFTPVLLVELLPLDTFTKAYGLTLMCQGVGHLIGPPLGGLLKDLTGTWSLAFHLSGAQIVVAGILILLIPYTKNRRIFGSGPVEKELENEKA